jgi:hypothetical protein
VKLAGDCCGVGLQATIGNAKNPIARRQECGVAGAIPLEGGAVMVIGETIEFDDETLPSPYGIDLEAEHGRIYRRRLKPVLSTKADEEILQCRASELRGTGFGEEAANRAKAPAAEAQLADPLHLAQAETPESVGLLPGRSETMEIHHFRKVEERAGDRSDWNPAANLTLLRW